MSDPVVFRMGKTSIHLSQLRYFTYALIGVGILWPWNCFLSASGYYIHRFESTPILSKVYSSTMMLVSTITQTGANVVLAKRQQGANYDWRIKFGFYVTAVIFLVMSLTCVVPLFLSMGNVVFFVLLMAMVLGLAVATAFSQNGAMATANVLGPVYANAVMVGQAVAGVLPSTALIFSIFLTGSHKSPETGDRDVGISLYYFTASVIAIALVALLVVSQRLGDEELYQQLLSVMDEEGDIVNDGEVVPFSVLWSRLRYIVLAIMLTFAVTLAFPVFALEVILVRPEPRLFFFTDKVFIPVVFFTWNLGDLLGRVLCGFSVTRMFITDPKTLFWYSVARIGFIPLLFTTNLQGKGAIINSDAWYLFLQLAFGISNGQLATLSFMAVGDHCKSEAEKEAAGGFTTVFLSVGLMVGSLLLYVLVWLIN